MVEIVREGPDTIAETILRRMRRQAADFGATDQTLGDGDADES